jgi:hypothetical protein
MKAFTNVFCIISIAFVLLSSLPCYAQTETQGLFSLMGMSWKLQEPCSFDWGGHEYIIRQIGFRSDSMWFGRNFLKRFFTLGVKYKVYNPGLPLMMIKFQGGGSWGSYDSYSITGFVFPFL